ncbi:hypothetical protein [Janthinobacterium sp. PSPC1-1]|uniref:hypothetical protein n=1 Tax=Janthinobacterium sp. PSPC1-1 TaxID=2804581 RepID=UPI003CEDB60C
MDAALAVGGWLAFTNEGVIVNHFDELNGATAKTRMVTAKHVAHHRNVGATVTQAALQEKYSSVTLKADDHISPGYFQLQTCIFNQFCHGCVEGCNYSHQMKQTAVLLAPFDSAKI